MNRKTLLKRLLILTLFILPIAWLAISDTGQRYTGLFLLKLKGDPSFDIDFATLTRDYSEKQMRSDNDSAEFDCQAVNSEFGNRSCVARISSFNGNLAHLVTYIYSPRGLQSVKIYHRGYFAEHLFGQLVEALGNPEQVTISGEKGPTVLLRWRAGSGDLMLRKSGPEPEQPPTLIWVDRSSG